MIGRHLTRERLLAAVDDIDGSDAPHLLACARCRDEVASLRAVLNEVRDLETPEPSPLYWDALAKRIGAAVRQEQHAPAPRRAWAAWFGWASGLAVASSLALLTFAPGQGPSVSLPQVAGIEEIDLVTSTDENWDLLVSLAETGGPWTDEDAVNPPPGSVEQLVAELTDEERTTLVRLLESERGVQ